jgi:quercetin dioxygenase-like cupin family protein
MFIEYYPWGSMAWQLSEREQEIFGNSVALMTIEAGHQAEQHYHDNADECVLCEAGTIEIHFEDDVISLSEGEHYIIPKDKSHYVANSQHQTAKARLIYNHSNRNYSPTKKAA